MSHLMYSKEVIENFMNPKNMGEIKDADGIGKVGNPVCGDVMWLYIKVEEKDGRKILKDVKFKTFGCAAAIATSSMITQMAIGQSLEEAEKINKDQIVDKLKGLPPVKYHCSILADKALAKAIEDYKKKNEKSVKNE